MEKKRKYTGNMNCSWNIQTVHTYKYNEQHSYNKGHSYNTTEIEGELSRMCREDLTNNTGWHGLAQPASLERYWTDHEPLNQVYGWHVQIRGEGLDKAGLR